jgi:hypothetical protein
MAFGTLLLVIHQDHTRLSFILLVIINEFILEASLKFGAGGERLVGML